jgi:ADP-ribose pyrophosphatase YjhB (NUDIX family)
MMRELKSGRSVPKSAFHILSKLVLQPYHRQARGLTLGTRTAVFDQSHRVLLVRHTYAPGWLLPGGGVERGETIGQSAIRELHEEAGVIAEEPPMLLGICLNDAAFPGDHVAVLSLRRFRRDPFTPNAEIAAAEFFSADDLPPETTVGTRHRLNEIAGGLPIAAHW